MSSFTFMYYSPSRDIIFEDHSFSGDWFMFVRGVINYEIYDFCSFVKGQLIDLNVVL